MKYGRFLTQIPLNSSIITEGSDGRRKCPASLYMSPWLPTACKVLPTAKLGRHREVLPNHHPCAWQNWQDRTPLHRETWPKTQQAGRCNSSQDDKQPSSIKDRTDSEKAMRDPPRAKHRADPFHTGSQKVPSAVTLSQESLLSHNFTDLLKPYI